MTKNQLLALAAFITSLANEGECSTTTETAPAGDTPAPKARRGRPPTNPTPPETNLPTVPATVKPITSEQTAEDPAPAGGKTIDEMRALIEPLIKGSWNGKPQAEWQPRGAEVRPIILKYAPTLIQMDPKDYPAFQADIEALLY